MPLIQASDLLRMPLNARIFFFDQTQIQYERNLTAEVGSYIFCLTTVIQVSCILEGGTFSTDTLLHL